MIIKTKIIPVLIAAIFTISIFGGVSSFNTIYSINEVCATDSKTEPTWAAWKGDSSYTLKVGETLNLVDYFEGGGSEGYYCEAFSDDESIADVSRINGFDSSDPYGLCYIVYAKRVGKTTVTYNVATPDSMGFGQSIEIIVVDDETVTTEPTAQTTTKVTTVTTASAAKTSKTTSTTTTAVTETSPLPTSSERETNQKYPSSS